MHSLEDSKQDGVFTLGMLMSQMPYYEVYKNSLWGSASSARWKQEQRHKTSMGMWVFWVFVCLFLLSLLLSLKSSNSPGWSDTMHGSISISLFSLVLWLIMSSILEKVPWGGEKEVYSFVLVWNILHISVKSIWFITSINFGVSVFSVCVNVLSISESRVLKSPPIIE